MKKFLFGAIALALFSTPANALTIKSGEVLTTNEDGVQVTVPFHETENAKTQIEEKGYAVFGNNVAIAGIDSTLTIDEALELVRNGLSSADISPELKEVLESLDDEQLAAATEALNSGQVSAEDIEAAIAGGCDVNADTCEALDHVDLGE